MQRNRFLGLLPGLLFGAASIAKEQGLFGNPGGLTDVQLKTNNDGWKNLGAGRLPSGAENTAMTGAPMQLPGALPPERPPGLSLAGSPQHRAVLPPMEIGRPQQPAQAPQAWAVPQAPPPGLLSDPNEDSRRRFFQAQGVGPMPQYAMR